LGTTHRFSLLFLISALIVGGLAALQSCLWRSSRMYFFRVVVNIDAGDRPAERMIIEVTFPIEQAVRAVPGVRNAFYTSRGSAEYRSISIGAKTGGRHVAGGVGHQPSHAQSASRDNFQRAPDGPDRVSGPAYSLTSTFIPSSSCAMASCTSCGPTVTISGVAKIEV
jgi:hypothetical protein